MGLSLHPAWELALLDALEPAHIRTEHLGDDHRAVGLLEVLEDRHHGPAHRHPGAVQGVAEPGLPLVVAVAHPDAPRLEVLAVRHRADLAEGALAGEPDLDVVGLG